MTNEDRQRIICEHLFGKKYNAIAADMDITPQAISNDRRRHPDKWEQETQRIKKRCQHFSNQFQDDTIQRNRAMLQKILNPEERTALRAKYPENIIALTEIILCDLYSAALKRRYPE